MLLKLNPLIDLSLLLSMQQIILLFLKRYGSFKMKILIKGRNQQQELFRDLNDQCEELETELLRSGHRRIEHICPQPPASKEIRKIANDDHIQHPMTTRAKAGIFKTKVYTGKLVEYELVKAKPKNIDEVFASNDWKSVMEE
ncbi:hypothetical protein Adt_33022 [Abeliophyllum distichum]|uniref:Uncharacterized protein n=1 Tax=Abeliophyllum distichum TaxID=126358 RepID=A0ABD1QXR2_9LAMI